VFTRAATRSLANLQLVGMHGQSLDTLGSKAEASPQPETRSLTAPTGGIVFQLPRDTLSMCIACIRAVYML